jgi:Spy/CpxP family protein refolding chaperone
MLRLPLVLMFASLGMLVVVGSSYALPERPSASGGEIPKKMPTRTTGLLATVQMPQVQKVLNLSDEQKKKIEELIKEGASDNVPVPGGATTIIGAGGVIAMGSPLAKLAEILKPEQMERLKQLDLQAQGANALRKPELIRALGLNLEQQAKLNSIFKEADQQRREMVDRPVGRSTREFGAMRQTEQELMKKVLNVLTPEQRQKFEKMKGKAIHLPPPGVGPPGQQPSAGVFKGTIKVQLPQN